MRKTTEHLSSRRLAGMTRARPRKTGFTLIEILVVVAIISLLVVILMPALRKAREMAGGAFCKSNMNQIMKGMYGYIAVERALPGTSTVWWSSYAKSSQPPNAAGRRWANWVPSDSWLGLLHVPEYAFGVDKQEELWAHVDATVPRQGSLFRYLKSDKVYLCPSDQKGMPDPESPGGGGGNGTFSYTMNGLLGFSGPDKLSRFTYVANFEVVEVAMEADVEMIPKGTKVRWPAARMVTLFEEHPWNNTNHGIPSDSLAEDAYPVMRHDPRPKDAMLNLAYLDGHVQPKRYPYWGDKKDRAGNANSKVQGVDLMNEFQFPYDYDGNQGGAANAEAVTHQFTYPYQ